MRRVLTLALLAVLVGSVVLSPLAAHVSLAVTLPPQHAQFVARVLEIVNVERQNAGLGPLTANTALTSAAICLLERPRESSRRTSTSLLVKPAGHS